MQHVRPAMALGAILASLLTGCAMVVEDDGGGNLGRPGVQSTSLELEAMRIRPEDMDAAVARFRITELEGEPIDDATWEEMVDLAQSSVGRSSDTVVKEERRYGSVQARRGSILVDVLWQGEFAFIYYETGAADGEFFAMLQRLRDAGLTIVQGHELKLVTPETTIAEMVALQIEEQGL